MIVHRVINHRTSRDGTTYFLVKWRDLSYDQATWESEHEDIAGLKSAIEYYQVNPNYYKMFTLKFIKENFILNFCYFRICELL